MTDTLRLLSYNIRYGGSGREAALAAVIRAAEPHVAILQEATRPAVVERLADETGLRHWGCRSGESLAFLARSPVASAIWYRPRLSRHAFLELVPSNDSWRIFGVHLSAVHAAWTERRRLFELHSLLTSIQAHQHGPHVLVGDFNTVAPGEMFDFRQLPARLRALVWLSGGRIRWRTIQAVFDAGYRDMFRRFHPDRVGYTFPSWQPHVRLDYVFAPDAWVNQILSCDVREGVETRGASDHLPIVGELRLDTAREQRET
jgi:endonuclease/exonuclease/phosphatase family metal-dependent hydrolase